jgi:hypothetical protein
MDQVKTMTIRDMYTTKKQSMSGTNCKPTDPTVIIKRLGGAHSVSFWEARARKRLVIAALGNTGTSRVVECG